MPTRNRRKPTLIQLLKRVDLSIVLILFGNNHIGWQSYRHRRRKVATEAGHEKSQKLTQAHSIASQNPTTIKRSVQSECIIFAHMCDNDTKTTGEPQGAQVQPQTRLLMEARIRAHNT